MTICPYCPHHCDIAYGGTGICGMYTAVSDEITERFPDHWLMVTQVSVETIPFVHAFPQAKALQVSTIGCNLKCPGCVSEVLVRNPDDMGTGLRYQSAKEIIDEAEKNDCKGIVFCLNEPTVSLPSFLSVAKLAKEKGMFVGCSSNGYFSEHTLNLLLPVLDMINIGLKGKDEKYLRACGIIDDSVVIQNIKKLVQAGVHVETALMHAKGQENDLITQAKEVVSISEKIPIQIMRCMAFGDLGQEFEPSIPESELLCDKIREYASHVYLFNSPGTAYINTVCPDCGDVLSSREMYGPMGCRPVTFLDNRTCSCGYKVPLTGMASSSRYEEEGMDGGYRPTRALECIQGIVTCLGVDDPLCAPRLWKLYLSHGKISSIHERIQKIPLYYGLIREVAEIVDKKDSGEELLSVLEEMKNRVTDAVKGMPRPRVLYTMGYPIFSLNGGRFENQLVDVAGGEPVNRLIKRSGKPGVNLSHEEFLSLNPDWICISGLFSLPKEECIAYCKNHALLVPAVTENKVVELPPSWDFGSPRWILGLMLLARSFHPKTCTWNMDEIADQFYQRFYHVSYRSVEPTRSFIKASAKISG